MKRNKILYWIATVWLALGMLSTGIAQLLEVDEAVVNFMALGYPKYLMSLLGAWKILGVTAILIPKQPLLKEWAYAGFFFLMSGALFSHLAHEDDLSTLFGPSLLLVLTGLSWYLRPDSKKVNKRN